MKKLSKLGVVKNLKMIDKMIGKMIVDHDLIGSLFLHYVSDRDLIGDHIFQSDRDLIRDHENGDRAYLGSEEGLDPREQLINDYMIHFRN